MEQQQANNFAIKKLVRGPDGTQKVVYVDSRTGQPIQNLAGYQIIDTADNSADLKELGLSPTESPKEDKTTAAKLKEQIVPKETRNSLGSQGGSAAPRTQTNNFGYVDKPQGLGLAGALVGGPFGAAMGAVSKGIDANNAGAVSSARQSMGLGGLGIAGLAKETLMGNKDGKVANVNIGDNNYSVGLEAQDRFGRTTMTPDEARQRSLVTNQDLTESSPEESKSNIDSWKEENPHSGNTIAGSIAGGVNDFVTGAKDFLSSLFGGNTDTKKASYDDNYDLSSDVPTPTPRPTQTETKTTGGDNSGSTHGTSTNASGSFQSGDFSGDGVGGRTDGWT